MRIPLKQIHTNKAPIIAPAGMLTAVEAERLQISGDACRTHLAMLRGSADLKQKLAEVFSESPFEEDYDPDHMLYSGGFFSDADKQIMETIRSTPSSQLGALDLPFQDNRLEEMFLRYRARNYPHTLSEEERGRWEEYRRLRLLGPDNGGYLTMSELFEQLNALYQQPDMTDKQRGILEELALYAEAIYPMDEVF